MCLHGLRNIGLRSRWVLILCFLGAVSGVLGAQETRAELLTSLSLRLQRASILLQQQETELRTSREQIKNLQNLLNENDRDVKRLRNDLQASRADNTESTILLQQQAEELTTLLTEVERLQTLSREQSELFSSYRRSTNRTIRRRTFMVIGAALVGGATGYLIGSF